MIIKVPVTESWHMAGANVILDSFLGVKLGLILKRQIISDQEFDNLEYSDSAVRKYPLEIMKYPVRKGYTKYPTANCDDSEKLRTMGIIVLNVYGIEYYAGGKMW